MRSAQNGEEESKFNDEELLKPLKQLEQYTPAMKQTTAFYSTFNPDIIEDKIKSFLQSEKVEPKISSDKYKMKFSRTRQNKEGQKEIADITVNITQCKDNIVAVEFQRRGETDKQCFNEHYQEFRNEILKDFNDTVLA